MNLTLDTNKAKAADSIVSAIRETGKYVGVITRAEHLISDKGTQGLGLSFKTDSGQTADYLDIYTTKENGEELAGTKTVNALLACLNLRGAKMGEITFSKWDNETKRREEYEGDGYPDLMGKRIGLLLQKEIGTNNRTGADTERMTIFGVFQADTELTASEILDRKTEPKRLASMLESLAARPVRDNRKQGGAAPPQQQRAQAAKALSSASGGFDGIDDDIPW